MSRPEGTFRARIHRVGILRCVAVPPEVGAAFAEWRHPPVRLEIDGVVARTHMTPAGDGAYRLYLSGAVRRAAGVDTGDEVEVTVRLDPELQAEPFPEDVIDLAESIPGGLRALDTLPPGLRRQILEYLAAARTEPTRRKRLARLGELLRERTAEPGFEEDP